MAIGSFNLTIEKKEVDLSDYISIGPLKFSCTWRAKLMRPHHVYKNDQRSRGSPRIKIFCLPLSQKLMRPSPANPGMLEPFPKTMPDTESLPKTQDPSKIKWDRIPTDPVQ